MVEVKGNVTGNLAGNLAGTLTDGTAPVSRLVRGERSSS